MSHDKNVWPNTDWTDLISQESMAQLAFFFFVLPSQDAFWALVVLVGSPRYAMHGLLIPGLPKLLAYNDFHGNMRKRFLPKLHKHLVSIN